MVGRSVGYVLLTVIGLASVVSAAEDEGVLFFARQHPATAIEGQTVNVTFEIRNIGRGSVFDIKVTDTYLQAQKAFTVKEGTLSYAIAALASGEAEIFSVILECKKEGSYLMLPATAKYSVTEGEGGKEKTSYSTVAQALLVESLKNYKKRTDRHLDTYAIFLVLASFITAAPFGVYKSTTMKLRPAKVTKKRQ
mmetsp:Transcript_11612/g.35483  ORF Transcript_11612/g.35483 Transcript_11612/m.35483 type:complete len:194 (+) Transcript_11612:126-707(+)|eukprot:CAMPEP_0198722302 /NCGR_PEP_ID=MMETSP1475-20131203/79_1 /TAXON_ID= ORGANISM="Unidentified sp., Strain CCMP1999" /NCGR_SAMPLE_ID=MMETSP1475 /ASSEMBLY_ACC=CAM_ASM_001111 /LENGTH=193 /DNA_ID=CAMNT_0044483205 /DNA_START=108 /DNA_END=689 /DNA_ORIENTATION=+